jgi:cobalt/nickel transport protein
MIISHLFGASLVEGLITALGMAYLQKQHPEYLTSLRKVVAGPDVATGQAVRRPFWQVAAVAIGAVLVVIIAAGLIEGGGNPARFFGADWSQVRWPDVASMLLVTAIIAAVLIPLTWVVLPKSLKRVGTAFTALAVLAPLGLIAPGFAFGEGSAEDVHAAFGYVPTGLEQFSRFFSAPLAGYNIPLPFFSDANAPLWQAAVGYEISGIIGILLLGGLVWGLASLLRRGRSGGEVAPTPQTEPR